MLNVLADEESFLNAMREIKNVRGFGFLKNRDLFVWAFGLFVGLTMC